MLKDFVSARLSRFSRSFSVVTKTTDKSLGCNTIQRRVCAGGRLGKKDGDVVEHVFCLGVHQP